MNMKKLSSKKIFYLIIVIVSVLLIVYCSLSLLNCMVEYKYKIDENFDDTDFVISHKNRKIEFDMIIGYLKIFIVYLMVTTSFFTYKLFSKKKNHL